MRILLQFPEGLKSKALEYADKYKEEGHEVYLSCSPCFGACDLAVEEAKLIHADKIIHFGHSRFPSVLSPVNVEYIHYPINIDLKSLENILIDLKPYNSIGIATTIQHVHELEKIKEFFEIKGKSVLIGQGSLASEKGQVLGCDSGAVTSISSQVDAILFVGDGFFHALAIKIDKPVFVFNPYSSSLEQINDKIEKLKRKRKGLLAAAMVSKTFGILVSTKPGQFNLSAAKSIKKKLEEKGKRAEILIGNTFDQYSLGNFQSFDCYITTACPRMSDDSEQFDKPILDLELCNELFFLTIPIK
ncbi:MAG: diphthamide biosynthesis enzyme Dph2 [Candidatus ainarchaeum sp.]|nr:diphthamide biosynthesis enzyme Dph2 [Candidatus ainarchaeum sp.]